MSVTPAVHAALVQAMDRLLAGEPEHSDGSLTVASLAREADVSRATAYRATEALEIFREKIEDRTSGPDVPATLRGQIRELKGELREAKRARHEEIQSLLRSIDVLAQQVQALTLENSALRDASASGGKLSAMFRMPHTATEM
ncbi:hypothetical protein ACWDUC_21250 [Streptomyces tricolor]